MGKRSIGTIATVLFLSLSVLQACGGGGGGGGSTSSPLVSLVTPTQGTVGTIVTLSGSGFLQSQGTGTAMINPAVTFTPVGGGAAAAGLVTAFTTTSLDVQVPQVSTSLTGTETSFTITVTNPDGGSTKAGSTFTMAEPVITDINGGLNGSGTVNSLFIIDGNNFGDLLTAPTNTAYPYSVDFRDATTNAVVASATVNYANNDWQNIFIVATVPNVTTSTTYKVTVTTPTGTSAPMNFLVLASVSFSPSTITWSATSSLPTAQQGFPTVIAPVMSGNTTTSYVYALGGNLSTSASPSTADNTDAVVFNVISNATGSIVNPWTATTSLPDKLGFAAAVSANSFNSLVNGNGAIYVLGGLDSSGTATSTVFVAPLSGDGTISTGTLTTTTALPQALFAEGAVIFHGRIYVAGGNDATGTPVAKVYSAKINNDGSLVSWQTLTDLPVGVAYHQLVTSAGYLYVLGGDTAAGIDPISNSPGSGVTGNIYYNQINIRTGRLNSWTANPSSIQSREKFSATVAGSYILVCDGLFSGVESQYAPLNTDGSVGSFNGATGSRTLSSAVGFTIYNHSSTYFVDSNGNPHVLILGGANTGSPGALQNGVWLQH